MDEAWEAAIALGIECASIAQENRDLKAETGSCAYS